MEWVKLIISVIVFSIVILVLYNLLKTYVLSKINANKWIVLAAAILIFFLPPFLKINMQSGIAVAIQSGIFVILFLWFMDLSGFGGRTIKKKEKIVIRPKAKPNRVKKK